MRVLEGKSRTRVGIVGTGTTCAIADSHVNAFKRIPELQVTAVYTRKSEQGKAFVERHGLEAQVCSDYQELLDRTDAVCICSPNATHAEYTIKAIQQGKKVLCEKPMVGSAEELKRLIELAQSNRAGNIVGFNYRYSWENRTLYELMKKGVFGKIWTFYQRKGGNRLAQESLPFEWRMDRSKSGMGAGIDFGSHILDNFLTLGCYQPEEIENITAETDTFIKTRVDDGGVQRAVTTDDAAVFIVRMKDGCRCLMDCSRVGIAYEEIQIVGSGAVGYYTQERPDELQIWEKSEAGILDKKGYVIRKENNTEEDTYYLQALDWLKSMQKEKHSACELEMACKEAYRFFCEIHAC